MSSTLRCWPPAPRDFVAAREVIRTACGREVIRTNLGGHQHRYQLWEPLIGASTYETTVARAGQRWGLARTRRCTTELPADEVARLIVLMEHEHRERRRAIDVLRRTVVEIGLTAGVAECVYETRGDILLFTDPGYRARRLRGAA